MSSTTEGAVATVRQFYDRCSVGDFAGALELLHDDLVVHEPPGLPYGGEYHGVAGFQDLAARMVALVDTGPVRPLEILDGDPVVVRMLGRFTSQASGESVEMGVVEVASVRDGKIVELDIYYKDPAAVVALTAG